LPNTDVLVLEVGGVWHTTVSQAPASVASTLFVDISRGADLLADRLADALVDVVSKFSEGRRTIDELRAYLVFDPVERPPGKAPRQVSVDVATDLDAQDRLDVLHDMRSLAKLGAKRTGTSAKTPLHLVDDVARHTSYCFRLERVGCWPYLTPDVVEHVQRLAVGRVVQRLEDADGPAVHVNGIVARGGCSADEVALAEQHISTTATGAHEAAASFFREAVASILAKDLGLHEATKSTFWHQLGAPCPLVGRHGRGRQGQEATPA